VVSDGRDVGLPSGEDLVALVARLREGVFDVVGESTRAAIAAARATDAQDELIRRLQDELVGQALERERLVLRAEADHVVLGLLLAKGADEAGGPQLSG